MFVRRWIFAVLRVSRRSVCGRRVFGLLALSSGNVLRLSGLCVVCELHSRELLSRGVGELLGVSRGAVLRVRCIGMHSLPCRAFLASPELHVVRRLPRWNRRVDGRSGVPPVRSRRVLLCGGLRSLHNLPRRTVRVFARFDIVRDVSIGLLLRRGIRDVLLVPTGKVLRIRRVDFVRRVPRGLLRRL